MYAIGHIPAHRNAYIRETRKSDRITKVGHRFMKLGSKDHMLYSRGQEVTNKNSVVLIMLLGNCARTTKLAGRRGVCFDKNIAASAFSRVYVDHKEHDWSFISVTVVKVFSKNSHHTLTLHGEPTKCTTIAHSTGTETSWQSG